MKTRFFARRILSDLDFRVVRILMNSEYSTDAVFLVDRSSIGYFNAPQFSGGSRKELARHPPTYFPCHFLHHRLKCYFSNADSVGRN